MPVIDHVPACDPTSPTEGVPISFWVLEPSSVSASVRFAINFDKKEKYYCL